MCRVFETFVIFIFFIQCACYGNVHDKVSYFEVISHHEADVRERRSVHKGSEFLEHDFSFRAFNITFNCHLKPRNDLFSRGFTLKVYGADGIPHVRNLQKDIVYIGTCDGDPASEIRGVFKGKLFSGSLVYQGHVYGLEDAKRHMTIPQSKEGPNEHTIVYRVSDMKWDKDPKKNGHGPSFCGNTHAPHEPMDDNEDEIIVDDFKPVDSHQHRHKRATIPTKNTCRIVAVADHKFYKNTGNNDVYDTALYISSVIDRVDDIYRKTTWSSITGLGFEIGEMRIYEAATSGFNQDTSQWQPLFLLQSFSSEVELNTFCAAHLFTHESFSGNVLGLAYIAPSRSGDLGGICSKTQNIEGSVLSLNTGWSSTKNGNGKTLLLQQANLVTAHGHNWGSEHDPESGGCAPSSVFKDGKYLMYPYSVSGYDSNNYRFSSCSRKYITKVLNLKRSSCLEAKVFDDNLVCGNGLIDPNEECDAGFMGRFGLDECCTSQCTLESGAECSPVNHECCLGCKPSPIGTLCRGETGVDCKETAYCSGATTDCPPSGNKTEGSCLDAGQCRNGVCLSFCEYQSLIPCACTEVATSCMRCCRQSEGAECKPVNTSLLLPDGRPCVAGACENGVCKSSSVSTISRLFDVLENLSLNDVVEFFRKNIVGAVMVFSIILWIPLSILVTCLDHRQKNKLDRSDNIEIRMNRHILYDEDKRRIENVPVSNQRSNGGATTPRYRNHNFTDLGGFGSDA